MRAVVAKAAPSHVTAPLIPGGAAVGVRPSIRRLFVTYPGIAASLGELVRAVVAHMPRVLASRLLMVPEAEALIVPLDGTVVFADLDGFTPLAERLSRLPANEGAEALTTLVNRFLAILIETSRRFGGDLLKFGGDAGLLHFGGADHALRAVWAADAAHQMMRRELSRVESPAGRFVLRAAIGIGSGLLAGIGVGDRGGREFLPIGPPLRAMGQAQALAPPGETVVDAATAAACGGRVALGPVGPEYSRVLGTPAPPQSIAMPGLPSLSPPTGADATGWYLARLDALAPYLPPGLLELIAASVGVGHDAVRSDRRLVTVMMASLPDPTYKAGSLSDAGELANVAQRLDAVFTRMRDTIQDYDGVLNKIAIGPAGPYVVAVFGAPSAHEDDPLRAVLAALALEGAFAQGLHIGINTGYVFAGDVGTGERREYTVMGDEVNLAARLMARCPAGAIWLGQATGRHPAVARRVVRDPGEPIRLRGKSAPIRPTIVRSLRQVPSVGVEVTTTLVDRKRELFDLVSRFSRRALREPRFVLLHGGAGVGKSALIAAVAEQVSARGVSVHTGAAPSYGGHLPFAGWDRVVLSLLGLGAVALERRRDVLMAKLLHHGVAAWAALIAPIVGLNVTPSGDVLALPPAMRDVQRQSALLQLLASAARERPRLLIFDNAQWMSSASMELLDAVIDALPEVPLDVCIVARDDSQAVSHWRNRRRVSATRLGPLGPEAMADLVASLLAHLPAPSEVPAWITARSGGLPIFATEAVRSLIDTGVLVRQHGAWALTGALGDVHLPDMVYALMQSRIDQLAPPDRHLLRAASVVGDEMTLQMLVAAYGEEPEVGVRRRLPNLVPFGLEPRDVNGQILFFRQPLVREVAYRGLTRRLQVEIHRRLTDYLDLARDAATPVWLTSLAHHAFEGRLWRKAVHANLALGRQAVQAYLVEQAHQSLTRVLAAAEAGHLDVPEARFEAHCLMSETATSLGLYDEALAHLDAARGIVQPGNLGDAPGADAALVARVASLDYREATILEGQTRYREALALVERSLAMPGVTAMVEGARLALMGANLQRRLGNYAQARAWAARAVALCREGEDDAWQQARSRAMYMVALLASLERREDRRPG